jgi:hypothetical protein
MNEAEIEQFAREFEEAVMADRKRCRQHGSADWLVIHEAAALLGFSEKYVRRLIGSPGFPKPIQRMRKGKILLNRAELLLWQQKQRRSFGERSPVVNQPRKAKQPPIPESNVAPAWQQAMR